MLPKSLHHQPDAQPEGAQDPAAAEVLEALEALVTTTHAVYRFAHTRITHVKLPAQLSGPRLCVLFAVKEAGSLRMGDLAAQLGVAARTVTDLVDGLEKAGLLTRRPDPRDRRATSVRQPRPLRPARPICMHLQRCPGWGYSVVGLLHGSIGLSCAAVETAAYRGC
jgi:DNA-binding transcriptional ArsR family regulator